MNERANKYQSISECVFTYLYTFCIFYYCYIHPVHTHSFISSCLIVVIIIFMYGMVWHGMVWCTYGAASLYSVPIFIRIEKEGRATSFIAKENDKIQILSVKNSFTNVCVCF